MENQINYTIKQITATDTIAVRQPILRAGKPHLSSVFDGDELDTTFHLGVFNANQLVGVVSYLKANYPLLNSSLQYQLRGMAVLNEYQNKGLGNLLLNYGEHKLKTMQVPTIWCNARENAVSFYKKNNFIILGDKFEILNVGPHYVMFKNI